MEIIKKFEIYSLPNLTVLQCDFEKFKYQSSSIEKIVKKLQKNKGYNLRINPDEPCIIYGDYDHCTLQQFEKFLEYLCNIFDVKIDDISYTSSKNNTSFHYSIPSMMIQYLILPGITWYYLVLPGTTWCYLVLSGTTWCYLTLPGTT